MRCEHTRPYGEGTRQCGRGAKEGYNLCHQHGWYSKYYIQFTWQKSLGDHWTRKAKAVWPILFKDRETAHQHMIACKPFRNMPDHRKLTCCVEMTKRIFPAEGLRKV